MILVCPQCQSQYNVDATKLGAHGRTVRCASCHHSWFQAVETPVEQAPAEQAEGEKVFQEILSEVSAAAVGALEGVMPEPAAEVRFTPQAAPQLPPAAVITHNPFGVGPSAFGGLVLVLLVSVTLGILILARGGIVRHWPQTALLYKTIGIHVAVPGEGFRLAEISAEQRIDRQGGVLVVEGKVTNMAEGELDYPPLSVELRDAGQAVLKQWNVDPGATRVASGETVPLMLQLQGATAQGKTVSVRVRGD